MGPLLKTLLKTLFSLIFVCTLLVPHVQGQNYRDQKKLIRLKPNKLFVFGKIKTSEEETLSDASISLFNPKTSKIEETIPVDDLGEYLFTLEKGISFGLIIEKDGLFPYYTQFVVPNDLEEEWENHITLPSGLRKNYKLHYKFDSLMPSNSETLDELIEVLKNFDNLNVWMPADEDPVFQRREALIREKFIESGLGSYRLISGGEIENFEELIQLGLHGESGNPDFSPDEDPSGLSPENEDPEENTISENQWTLQFIASRNKMKDSDLKGVTDFRVFEGKDGYFRYTYGIYDTKEEADRGKNYLKSKGFSQAFAKKVGDLQKL